MKGTERRVPRATLFAGALAVAVVASLLWTGSASFASSSPAPLSRAFPLLAAAGSDAPGGTTAAAAVAPPALSWVNVTSSAGAPAPPGGPGANLVYDPIEQEFVYFGGCLADCLGGYGAPCPGYCPANETWVLKGGHWYNLTDPHDAPPARIFASMDFDANAGGVLLFGGWDGVGSDFSDTWLFQGGFWTDVSYLSAAPPGRAGAALAFDPDADENASILVGGCVQVEVGPCTSDTFAWRPGAGWSALNSSTPPSPRDWASMAYSPSDHALVYFGGRAGCIIGCTLNDTWEFYAGTWWTVHTNASAPPGRYGAVMMYDAALGAVVLASGRASDVACCLTDAFAFTHGTWTALSLPAPPAARFEAAADPDGAFPTPVVVGGVGAAGSLADLWALEPTLGVSLHLPVSPVRVGQPASTVTTIVGGTAPLSVRIDFGDSQAATSPSDGGTVLLSHSYFAPGTYALTTTATDDLGVAASASATITVTPGPVLLAAASPPAGDVGQPVQFTAALVNEPAAPAGFAWTFGDGANATGVSVSHTYTEVGSYAATVSYTDSNGTVSTAGVAVSVSPLPSVTLAAPVGAVAGAPVGVHADVTGGSAPYRYAWAFGDGSRGATAAPVHAYAAAGTYTIDLWLNDSAGASVHQTAQVVVAGGTSPTAPASGPAPPPSWFWPGVAIVLVAGAVGALFLRWRRRRP